MWQQSTLNRRNDDSLNGGKCPVMLKSMNQCRESSVQAPGKTSGFDCLRQNYAFQLPGPAESSTGKELKRHEIRRDRPLYRQTHRYLKRKEQYWKERNRRKEALRLNVEEHLDYRQIAEGLGVSEKTVQRDLKKISRYHLGQLRRTYESQEQAILKEVDAQMESMTLTQRLEFISKSLTQRLNFLKQREYSRHNIRLTIDLDNPLPGGSPSFSLWPKPPTKVATSQPWNIHIFCLENGKKHPLGNLTIG